jgi:hypothetical protein
VSISPAECPTPIYHETHYYCPSCTFVADDAPVSEATAQRGRADHLYAELGEALAEVTRLRAQVEAVQDPTFEEMVERLTWWLDEHYPADIFTGVSGNPGPVFVVAVRAAIAALGEEEG